MCEHLQYKFKGVEGYETIRPEIKKKVSNITGDFGIMGFYIAINEAVSNALLYSKVGFLDVLIFIDLIVKNSHLMVRVYSESNGFNVAKYIEKMKVLASQEEYADWSQLVKHSVSGRGIWLMLTGCEKVVYNEKGDCVVLIVKAPSSLKVERRPKRILSRLVINPLLEEVSGIGEKEN